MYCDTINYPQIVQTIVLDLPIGLLFLGKNDMSSYYSILYGKICYITSFYLAASSLVHKKHGRPSAPK